MRKNALLILTLLLSLPNLLVAQSAPSLSEEAKNDLRTSTHAIAVLSGDDSVSAGTFKFKNEIGPDADLDLVKVVGEFSLGDPDGQFVPLIEISPALVDIEQDFRDTTVRGSVLADSWGIGAGVGLRMKFFGGIFEVTPRFKVEYLEVDYDFSIEGVDEAFIDGLSPGIDAWSYIPSLEAKVTQEVGNGAVGIYDTQVSYVYVDASTSGANFGSFSDDSWVWKNTVAYEHPLGSSAELFVRPSIGRIDIHGAARNGFAFNNFYEFGLDLASRSILSNYFNEVGIGLNYIYEKEFQGWRFGLFGELA